MDFILRIHRVSRLDIGLFPSHSDDEINLSGNPSTVSFFVMCRFEYNTDIHQIATGN